jgi:hypothetical protein
MLKFDSHFDLHFSPTSPFPIVLLCRCFIPKQRSPHHQDTTKHT